MGRPPLPQNMIFTVSVVIGDGVEFIGDGNTPQAARHDAASKALAHLKADMSPGDIASSPEQGRHPFHLLPLPFTIAIKKQIDG